MEPNTSYLSFKNAVIGEKKVNRIKTGFRVYQNVPKYRPLIFYSIRTEPTFSRTSKPYIEYKSLSLEDQFVYLISAITLTDEEKEQREKLLSRLRSLAASKWPNCTFRVFGSFVNETSDPESDVDIQLNGFGDSYETRVSPVDEMTGFLKLCLKSKLSTSNAPLFSQIQYIAEARVPILKLTETSSSINIDVMFEREEIKNSELIKLYISKYQSVKPLIIITRFWAKCHSLNGTNKIKNYAITLMVINFLTREGIIPAQDMMIKKYFTKENEENIYLPQDSKLTSTEIIKLLIKFFKLYGNYNFKDMVICTLTGEDIPKANFSRARKSLLPQCVQNFDKKSIYCLCEKFQSRSAMCIQDPIELALNVCSGISETILEKFQKICLHSKDKLEDDSFNCFLDLFIPDICSNIYETSELLAVVTEVNEILSTTDPATERAKEELIHSVINCQSSDEFVNLFCSVVKGFGNNQFIYKSQLFGTMQLLWVNAVDEFLASFWTSILRLQVTRKEHCKLEKNHKRYTMLYMLDDKSLNDSNTEDPFRRQLCSKLKYSIEMRNKLKKLGSVQHHVKYQKYVCIATSDVIFRARDRSIQEVDELVKGTINPIDIESEISYRMTNNNTGMSAEPLSFNLYVKVDCSLAEEYPSLEIVSKKISGSDEAYNQAIIMMTEIISDLFPRHQIYQLKKWIRTIC